MKKILLSCAAVLFIFSGCATTQTAGTGGGAVSDYEAAVMDALREAHPGQDFSEVNISPPSPVSGKTGVQGGFLNYSTMMGGDKMSFLYSYEIRGGDVALERRTIRKEKK